MIKDITVIFLKVIHNSWKDLIESETKSNFNNFLNCIN